jgi:three-Cys-motif partner protein
VFPRARYEEYRRALCLLDPYRLNLDWTVIARAGAMKSVEIFLNFMVMDMNRNVLWRNPEKVDAEDIARMSRFWGDESWREVAYAKVPNLFGDSDEKVSNEVIAQAYKTRLKEVAGFDYVPDPIPMRNSKGAVVYYLYFASPNKTGGKIVSEIFSKYRDKGAL